MIAGCDVEHAVRTAIVAWPAADLSGLLDVHDAVVCCARAAGGRSTTETLVQEMLTTVLPGATLTRGASGKPCVAAGGPRTPLHVSISHTGDLLAVAMSRTAELGVDIERVRVVPEWRAIAARMFDATTYDRLLADVACGAPEDEFIRYWCRHEAAVKATGEGLFPSNTRDDANDCNADRAVRVIDLPELPLPAGASRYRAALALLQ